MLGHMRKTQWDECGGPDRVYQLPVTEMKYLRRREVARCGGEGLSIILATREDRKFEVSLVEQYSALKKEKHCNSCHNSDAQG